MHRSSLILLLFICAFQLSAQDIRITGTITDQAKSPVDFALIYVEGLNIYTHSNDAGEFVLNIPEIKDSSQPINLIFQHVAYKKLRYSIKADAIQPLQITLEQSITTLSDVTVTANKKTKKIDPKRIVQNAVTSISSNYDQNPSLIHGYYSKQNILYGNSKNTPYMLHLREAIIHQLNPGITQDLNKQRLHISHVRATKDYRSLYEPFSQRDTLTGFIPTAEYNDIVAQERNYLTPSQFMNLNPVQVQGNFRDAPQYRWKITYDWYGKLNTAFVNNHKFKLDQIAYDQYGQDSLYVIKILPSKKSIKMIGRSSYAIPLGKLFIHAQDYAIVRYEYGIFDNPKKFKGKTQALLRANGAISFRYKIVAQYTKIDEHYYLSYLRKDGLDLANHFASANYAITSKTRGGIAALLTNQTGANSLVVSQEFSATGFDKGRSVRDQWNSLRISKDFYDSNINYDTDIDFWKTYNYPPETEQQQALRLALEERVREQIQLRDNGSHE